MHIINIKFNNDELKKIYSRGKGYCEMLMIKNTIKQLNLSSDCSIHKLTARYSLIFPNLLLSVMTILLKIMILLFYFLIF